MPSVNGPMRDPNMFTPVDSGSIMRAAADMFTDPTPDKAEAFAKGVQAWSASSVAMKAAAASGEFAINESGGQAYIDAYNRSLARLPFLQTKVYIITKEYKLGTSPGAMAVAPWNLRVAQQLATAFAQLETVYTNARDAYTQAMKNYRENEESVTFTFQQLSGQE